MPEDHYLPKNFVAVDKPSEVLEDHYVLYKAKAATDMGDWTQDDGSLEMSAIATHGGGDFNHVNAAWY